MNSKTLKNFFIGFAMLGIIIVMTLVLISIWGDIDPEFIGRTVATYGVVFLSIRLISVCIKNFGK